MHICHRSALSPELIKRSTHITIHEKHNIDLELVFVCLIESSFIEKKPRVCWDVAASQKVTVLITVNCAEFVRVDANRRSSIFQPRRQRINFVLAFEDLFLVGVQERVDVSDKVVYRNARVPAGFSMTSGAGGWYRYSSSCSSMAYFS